MKTFHERRAAVANYMQNIKKKRRKTILTVTSLTLVAAVLGFVLFVPYDTTPPDVSMYADSDYYELIQGLNEATYKKPRYRNGFQFLAAGVGDVLGSFARKEATGDAIAPMPNAPNSSPTEGSHYEETTDNQVEGVIEADIIKRSDQYIYYLRGNELSVYSIAGEASEKVGTYRCKGSQAELEHWKSFFSYWNTEMFLSQDCTVVTLLMTGSSKVYQAFTLVVNLDVSDPANIRETSRLYFVGDYVSARMVDGDLLLAYNHRVYASQIDFADETTFVPLYGTPGDMHCIPAENIVCPDNVSNPQYTVICRLDGKTLAMEGSTALLSYSQELYVSEDTIYATHTYTQKNQESFNKEYRQSTMTEITGISYADGGLEILDTIALEGSVKDQYSMDRYDGVLRVVTSTSVSYFVETFYGEYASTTNSVVDRNVNLYCIDLSNWEIAAEVIAFAPNGEDAQSVRFDGPNAYVCTAEVITFSDPVYFFDLSDLDNITYTDTGTISGYSTSLIQLGEGFLLGIGYGDSRSTLKIEVYEELNGKVVSVCAYEANAFFSENYKSYFVDRERNLIGLGIESYDNYGNARTEYLLLHFNGYKLQEVLSVPLEGTPDRMRGVMIDEFLYLFSDADAAFCVETIG